MKVFFPMSRLDVSCLSDCLDYVHLWWLCTPVAFPFYVYCLIRPLCILTCHFIRSNLLAPDWIPFDFRTFLILCGTDSTRSWKHYSVSRLFMMWLSLSTTSQISSTGLGSVDWGGHEVGEKNPKDKSCKTIEKVTTRWQQAQNDMFGCVCVCGGIWWH